MNKVLDSADEAVARILDGATLMVGGFGVCGNPENLLLALHRRGTRNLTVISNNAGIDDFGLGPAAQGSRQIRKMIASYVGENREFERQFLAGELEVELVPQGTFSERIRAGGAGIGGFFTPTGYGTVVAEGQGDARHRRPALRARDAAQGRLRVRARAPGDRLGNLVYRKTARNFNPMMATAARVHDRGGRAPGRAWRDSRPTTVHTPGIFVRHILQGAAYEHRVEKRTVREPRG